MPRKGWRTFSIRNERLEQLTDIYQHDTKRPSNQEFGGWFDELLLQLYDNVKTLREYGPFLEFWNAEDNMINIFDHKLQEPVSIFLDGPNKCLKCSKCKRQECLHIGFCFAIPEVYKVLIKHGFKTPIHLKKPKGSKMLPLLALFLSALSVL